MQENFLNSLIGRSTPSYQILEDSGISHNNGYIQNPHGEKFLSMLSSEDIKGGPYIFKTHTFLNGKLRKIFAEKPNIFFSLIIRDPRDVFFSARDNHAKTGEFEEFSSVESGVNSINGYFSMILQSTLNSQNLKHVPIVRYESVIDDPLEALHSSLHSAILRKIFKIIITEHTNLTKSRSKASNRLNLATKHRPEAKKEAALYAEIDHLLSPAVKLFGYKDCSEDKGPLARAENVGFN
jgi:hypothetical protein